MNYQNAPFFEFCNSFWGFTFLENILKMHGDKTRRLKRFISRGPLPPALCDFGAEKGGILKSCHRVPNMTSEGLGEIFKGAKTR